MLSRSHSSWGQGRFRSRLGVVSAALQPALLDVADCVVSLVVRLNDFVLVRCVLNRLS
jgi:hypothetical protein